MKKINRRIAQLLVLCLIITSMTGMVFAEGDGYTVRLTPSADSVIKGESVTIDVEIEGDDYACADIKVQYDTSKVTYESAEGIDHLEVSDSTPAGTLHITCYGDVQTGGTTLSTLTFTTTNTGTASFTVSEAKAATTNVVSLSDADVSSTSVLIKGADVPDPNPDPGETFGKVEITAGEHGTVSASPEQAKAGDTVSLITKPDEGYTVDRITAADADGKTIDVTDNGDGTYTFTMPTGKASINITFAPIIAIDAGTNGTATVDNNSPKTGDKVTVTVKPNDGYEVDEVTATDRDGNALDVTDNGDGTYSFTKPEGNVSVKVTYKAADKHTDENCPSRKYSDLDTSLWYHEAVDFVLNNKYFQGTGDTTFEPDYSMTRAMFVTVLSRMEGIDAAQYTGSDFTDVEIGQWYTAPIQWASRNGIVLGIGEQKFDPEGEVTREQMAAIMYRYAQYKKIDTTKADASKFGSFSDKDSVSDWAVEAMTWATGVGIINGTDTGIEPQANSTRAQVAQIVKNYTEKVS